MSSRTGSQLRGGAGRCGVNHRTEAPGLRLATPTRQAVLGLLSTAGWVSGDGALANVALERAAHVPGQDQYTMLQLLAEAIEASRRPPHGTT